MTNPTLSPFLRLLPYQPKQLGHFSYISPDQQMDVSAARLFFTPSSAQLGNFLGSLAMERNQWWLVSRSAWLFYTSMVRIVYFMRAARSWQGRSGLSGAIYASNDDLKESTLCVLPKIVPTLKQVHSIAHSKHMIQNIQESKNPLTLHLTRPADPS